MSYFTWFGAVLGSALAHLGAVGYDLSSLPTQNKILQFISRDNVKGPVNVFACTLSGALIGHVAEVTWNVSVPTLLIFVLSYCAEVNFSKYFTNVPSITSSVPRKEEIPRQEEPAQEMEDDDLYCEELYHEESIH
jgi:hypothetical protein